MLRFQRLTGSKLTEQIVSPRILPVSHCWSYYHEPLSLVFSPWVLRMKCMSSCLEDTCFIDNWAISLLLCLIWVPPRPRPRRLPYTLIAFWLLLFQAIKLESHNLLQCLWNVREIGFGPCWSETCPVLEILWPGLACSCFGKAGTARSQLWLVLGTLTAL